MRDHYTPPRACPLIFYTTHNTNNTKGDVDVRSPLGHTPKPDGAITIQLVLCIFLGVRAVKGADADEVLFVG